ncbi:hypothetical protein FB45DRAFT_899871 [Roridomyces roridus]|uniref:Uncharacterized protein n=1 Tax=Roridomyces roridus TaxID=1738132 RepID=A0AAD7C7A0_9AGAR|nr:hypothetical protein FB45DRAFT_899871 [Roridomyces roridus]
MQAKTSPSGPPHWINIWSFASIALHICLIALHIALVVHRLVYPLAKQGTVSFWITVIVTTFGTVYYAALIFVTQKLAMRRCLRKMQTLTATHDTAAAWSGIGAAAAGALDQFAVRASYIGVGTALVYLGGILALHVTTPAIFSVQAFNESVSQSVVTQGVAQFNLPSDDRGNLTALNILLGETDQFSVDVLQQFPYIARSTNSPGLQNATLYHVPLANASNTSPGGTIQVEAMGVNVSCGYLKPLTVTTTGNVSEAPVAVTWSVTVDTARNNSYAIQSNSYTSLWVPDSTPIFSQRGGESGPPEDLIFFAPFPNLTILDSKGAHAPPAKLVARNKTYETVTEVTLMRCFASPVVQNATIDSDTLRIIDLSPSVVKTSSVWAALPVDQPPQGPPLNESDPLPMLSSTLLDLWQIWYMSTSLTPITTNLGLPTEDTSESESDILWETAQAVDMRKPSPFTLAQSEGILTQTRTLVRVNAALGLAVSILLTVPNDKDTPAASLDLHFLQAMWLYRNHTALKDVVLDVKEPTKIRLREAGMVKVCLADVPVGGGKDDSELGSSGADECAEGSSLLQECEPPSA